MNKGKRVNMPWWVIVLMVIGSLVVGGLIASCATLLYIGKGMWQ